MKIVDVSVPDYFMRKVYRNKSAKHSSQNTPVLYICTIESKE